jgi:hypothetical protein
MPRKRRPAATTTPDIQQLLKRHVFGSQAERRQIERDMDIRMHAQAADVLAAKAETLARAAASRGLRDVEAGNTKAAREAQAEAEAAFADMNRWLAERDRHLSTLKG